VTEPDIIRIPKN